MRVNTKLNIILLLFILEFIFFYLLYMKAFTIVSLAEIQLDRAENLVRLLIHK